MKTLENHFIKNFAGIKFCSCLLLMLFVFGCTKVESPLIMSDDSSDAIFKSKIVVNEPINFEGTSHFDIYAAKEKIVLSDGDEAPLLMTATLTPLGGQNYLLETEEYMGPDLYREISFDVKITPGGVVMFSWPETWKEFGVEIGSDEYNVIDQVKLHLTCSDLYGPGVNNETLNYKGYFDGTYLHVSTHFIGKQADPGLEGPILFEFSFELTKVD